MNKKNIILILLLACFLTIMSISIWGKNPELSSRIPVSGIVINDSNNNEITLINDSSLKEKKIELDSKDYEGQSEVYVFFSVAVNPSNATDLSLTCTILENNYEEYVSITEVDYSKWTELSNSTSSIDNVSNYHFYYLTFTDLLSCTVKIQSNREDISKTDYLKVVFKKNNEGGTIEI